MELLAIIIILLIYSLLLELSKNTVLGWVSAGVISLLYLIFRAGRRRSVQKEAPSYGRRSRAAMFGAWLLLLAIIYILSGPPDKQVPAAAIRNPEVTKPVMVAQGELTGVYNESHTARIYAGIPYAEPPIGDLRWKEPQEAKAWEGIRACDTFGPMAMQQRGSIFYNSLTRILGLHDYRIDLHDNYKEAMSEDCLYLNVFAPSEIPDEPLPVLFFIHGGSLMTGQSSSTAYRGEDLASKGIIVVNFAYRLGVFGYFADEELSEESVNNTTGSYGLLDQIAALKWVHDNIEAFGGDPDNITIAGESAGASSVNAICVSPLTKGLFRRAIAESSGITPKHPYHTFRSMDAALAMGDEIMAEMNADSISDMREIPAEDLIKTAYQNSAMTLDGYAITKMPYISYLNNENHEEALLNGFNAKEADVFLLETEAGADNYESLLEPIFGPYSGEAAELVPAGSITRDQSFIIDAGGEAKGSLDHLYSAAWFTYSHELWSRYMADQKKPVYEYYFTKTNKSLSNYHAGEMPYAYGNLWRQPGVYEESDEEISLIMQTYWVNFVRTGDPNGENLPGWEKRTQKDQRLLEIGDNIGMIEDPYKDIYLLLDKYQDSK